MKRIIFALAFASFSLFSFAQTTLYSEDFTGQNGKGATGGGTVTYDTSGVSWRIVDNAAGLTATSDYFKVDAEEFEAQDVDFTQAWYSPIINIATYTNVSISLDAVEVGTMEAQDTLRTEYRVDGGSWTIASTNGDLTDDFSSATVSQAALSGSTLEIKISIINNSGSERHAFDNVLVTGLLPGALSASVVSSTNVSCNGGSDGSITVTTTNGTANYDYSWSNGATTFGVPSTSNTVNGLTAGNYTVTVTDGNGNTATASSSITEPTAIVVSINLDSNVSCNGLADGGLTANVSGGSPNYNFLWSNGPTTPTQTGLVAGNYTVTVTDANNCVATSSLSVSQPNAIQLSLDNKTNESCANGDGQITVMATGGTGVLSFDWSNGTSTTSQSIVSHQGFDGTQMDNWNFAIAPATYNTSGDVWSGVNSLSNISPNAGSSFWGMSDLNNGNGGGNFYHTLTFDPIDVSQYQGASVNFDYYTIGFDGPDELEYEVVFDNGNTWSTNGTALNKNTGMWTTVSTPIPNNTNFVRIRIQGLQNGSDYAGIDNVNISVSTDKSSINNLVAGVYDVTVSDENGCQTVGNYSINLNCANVPKNLRVNYIQDTSAMLTWDTMAGATLYKVRWKGLNDLNWNVNLKYGQSNRLFIDTLTISKTYIWQVMAYIPNLGAWTDLSYWNKFTTLSTSCYNPTNLRETRRFTNSAKLEWDLPVSAEYYRFRYRIFGGAWVKSVLPVTRDAIWLLGLTADTTYEWQIKSVCQAGISSGNRWTGVKSFKTRPLPPQNIQSLARLKQSINPDFSIYPNPNNGNFTYEMAAEKSINAQIQIFDLLGKVVYENNVQTEDTFVKRDIVLDSQKAGIYIMRISNSGSTFTERIVVR